MMQADGLQANVVTYNTLIDIYGKLGRWQEAIEVLDMIAERVSVPDCFASFGRADIHRLSYSAFLTLQEGNFLIVSCCG